MIRNPNLKVGEVKEKDANTGWFARLRRVTAVMRCPARSAGLDLLEERYARGEINRDEYLQKNRDISG